MKHFVLSTIIITIYGILSGSSVLFWKDKFQASLVVPPEKDHVTLLFAGDIMLDRGVEFYITKQNDWKLPFRLIANTLQKADLVFGNLESVISDKGQNVGSMYSFRADPKILEGLTFAGFDVLSVANNHSLDYGAEALLDSIQRLKDAGIVPVGGGETEKETNAPILKRYYTSKYGSATTIGILAYTATGSPLWQAGEQSPGIAWMDALKLSQLKEDIKATKELSDVVVVSLHFGEEYQTQPSETQKLIAKSAIDAGANLVIGHHPHVVQPIEQYKQGWIAYSLGNFVFDQGFSKETMEGLLLEAIIEGKQITGIIPRPVRLNAQFQPALQNLTQ